MAASDSALERESLRDLDGVRVVAEESPLGADPLRKFVEARLRAAGVSVLNSSEHRTGDPFLRVRVSTASAGGEMSQYLVELDFAQIVFLRRNPAVTFNRAQTWRAAERMALVPSANLAEKINQELAGQVDQFIGDYLAVNPK